VSKMINLSFMAFSVHRAARGSRGALEAPRRILLELWGGF
jgi:hypothetical protein